ncbi:hypothetical protein GCM10020000_32300 [Streptomyces olivoverticillatus]
MQETELKGRISGVEGEVYVWLPPQYDDPAYKDKKFPVAEVLPGFPGSAKAWFGTLDVASQLKPMMEKGEVAPFIIVAPRTTLLGDVDSGCANVPGKVNADTWLSVDVRKMVTDTFRAADGPDGWAVAGYSAERPLRRQAGHRPPRPLPGRGQPLRLQRPGRRASLPDRQDARAARREQPLEDAPARQDPAARRALPLGRGGRRLPGRHGDQAVGQAADDRAGDPGPGRCRAATARRCGSGRCPTSSAG